MDISGTTSVVAVLGHPVGHTMSPAMHNAAFRSLDMDWVYVAFDVPPKQLGTALRGAAALGLRGINLTVSLKETAAALVDRMAPSAARTGSVNTVEITESGLIGHSTDGIGFLRSVKEDLGLDLAGRDVMVVGAGGAATAIVYAALDAEAGSVTIVNRTFERAERLVAAVRKSVGDDVAVTAVPLDRVDRWYQNVDLFVNATTLGWKPDDPTPVPPDFFKDGMAVLDTCYNACGTPLLDAARHKGLLCADGMGMLVYQGAAAFEIWTGREAPVEVMKHVMEGR